MLASRRHAARAGLGTMRDESNTAPQAGQEYARDDEVAEVAGIDWDHAE